MTAFRINLIRNRPVPLPQRTAVALPLLLGLFTVGALLALSINKSVWDVRAALQRQRQTATERALFAQQHPLQADVSHYCNTLRHQLEEAAGDLNVTEELLTRRTPSAIILYTLTTALPRKIHLLNLDLSPIDHTLHFELAIPIEPDGRHTDPTPSLTLWHSAPAVQKLVSDVREESCRQAKIEESPLLLIRYNATLKEN